MENSIYTEENLERFTRMFNHRSFYEKDLSDSGSNTEFNDSIDINYSSILTKLIQEAGRYCESYASDLFIDWNSLNDSLKDGSIESNTMLFGFREMGVDSRGNIFCKADSYPDSYEYEYRSIWRLNIEVITDEKYWWHKAKKTVEMTLYRVSAPSRWEIEKFFKDLKSKKTEEASVN